MKVAGFQPGDAVNDWYNELYEGLYENILSQLREL